MKIIKEYAIAISATVAALAVTAAFSLLVMGLGYLTSEYPAAASIVLIVLVFSLLTYMVKNVLYPPS